MNRFLKRCLQKSEADFWTQNHFKLASVFKRITLFVNETNICANLWKSGKLLWAMPVAGESNFQEVSNRVEEDTFARTSFDQVFKSVTKSSSKLKSCCPTSSVSLFKTFIKTPFLHFFKFNISNFVIHFYHQDVSERERARETRKWERREREHWPWASRRKNAGLRKSWDTCFPTFPALIIFSWRPNFVESS